MDKRYILFDLDGTLTDSYEGIINAFEYCLHHYNVKPKPETYRKIIGPPVVWSLKTFYGFDEETAKEAVVVFRQYYESKGIFENRVYEGVELMLQTLRAHGKMLMVATTKPERVALKVLEHYGLSDYFCFVSGTNSDKVDAERNKEPGRRSTKEDVIKHIIKSNDIHDPENAVMVGDRSWDIQGGKAFKMQTIGMAYGYGSDEELREAGADYIARTPADAVQYILQ